MRTHDQHRPRLHHHHRNRPADDPESNSGWYPKPSPLYFSGKKYESTKNARGADRPPRPATKQSFTHSPERSPAHSTDTHSTSIRALRYNEVATEGLHVDLASSGTYFTALHILHARSICEGDATSHTGTATRFRGGTKAKPSSATHKKLHTARQAGLHERFPPSPQSFIRRQRHLRGRRLRGEGGNITKHTMHRRRTLNGITATREHRRDVTPRLQHDHEWRRGTANGAALSTTATIHPRVW